MPDSLRAARRYIDECPELQLVQDLAPAAVEDLWSFAVDVAMDVPAGSPLPPTTRWRIVLTPAYPWGLLEAFPDADHGITITFPHQHCNLPPSRDGQQWRRGLVCVRSPNFVFNRQHFDSEPTGSPERMRWFLRRLIAWLNHAANEALITDGDPFELPDFATRGPTMAWSECSERLAQWLNDMPQHGLADICQVCGTQDDGILAVRAFRDASGKEIFSVPWGTWLSQQRVVSTAVWVRLPSVPCLQPYQAPLTWGDMRSCFRMMGLPFDGTLRRAFQPVRDGLPHVALFGFPIPDRAGNEATIMHWQACKLPPLAYGVIARAGFRNNATGYWRQDCYDGLRRSERIEWWPSRNWHVKQMMGRGALDEAFRSKKIGIIGAGAVGSVLAELLVRSGLAWVAIVDGDIVEAGNLVRHTLSLDDVGRNKAEALADRLQRLSPNVTVVASRAGFPVMSEGVQEQLAACDVLIDCSAADDVMHAMESAPWNQVGLRVSLSLGFAAKRCYVYVGTGSHFALRDMQAKASEWFTSDANELAAADLPSEAVGCWHPLFPARIDGVWSMVSLAVRDVERYVQAPPHESVMIVYESADAMGGDAAIARRTV